MDFQELLKVANYNKNVAKSEATNKRYDSNLPPPKKAPKASVQSENIRKFLERKKAEEAAKAAEEQKKKDHLLSLRAQNSKNNKKAKIMASRTKDNDFSKIKLTDDEIEAKKKLEAELIKKNLADKVERMKARIELEEKEKLLPRKRKRKSKLGEEAGGAEEPDMTEQSSFEEKVTNSERKFNNKTSNINKPKAPPLPSYSELLKLAEQKRFEQVEIPVSKKEERLMTKKERKLMEEEQERLRRKQQRERMYREGENMGPSKSKTAIVKKSSEKPSDNDSAKKPILIRVEKNKQVTPPPAFHIPKKDSNKNNQDKIISEKDGVHGHSNRGNEPVRTSNITENEQRNKVVAKDQTKVPMKTQNSVESLQKNVSSTKVLSSKFDPEAMAASIEKKIRERLEKQLQEKFAREMEEKIAREMEEKLTKEMEEKIAKEMEEKIAKEMEEKTKLMQAKIAARFGLSLDKTEKQHTGKEALNGKSLEKSKYPSNIKSSNVVNGNNKKLEGKALLHPKSEITKTQRDNAIKKVPLKREERPFHKNPYLDPPRRLLEPQRPPKPPPKRRIESDDDEEDDDMSDFIDDGQSQNDEDYSKYIKEIFGYDRSRYVDDDDDDVVESSFVQQMKEECRSAKLGYLEDLEEERKLREMERKKKKKPKS